jgi:Na+/proline symporter
MWYVLMVISGAAIVLPIIGGYRAWSLHNYRQFCEIAIVAVPLAGFFVYATAQYIDHPMIIGDTNFGVDPMWHCYTNDGKPVCLKTN